MGLMNNPLSVGTTISKQKNIVSLQAPAFNLSVMNGQELGSLTCGSQFQMNDPVGLRDEASQHKMHIIEGTTCPRQSA